MRYGDKLCRLSYHIKNQWQEKNGLIEEKPAFRQETKIEAHN